MPQAFVLQTSVAGAGRGGQWWEG